MTSDDMTLVQEYAGSSSEQAFATLVSRHVDLVYSVALRQVRNPHLAEEITQSVFIILAGKAKSLSPKTILPGWLCRTARFVSSDTLKIQRRRQFRELESHMQTTLNEPEPQAWQQITPLLDEAMNCLGEKEHDAVVLRFFEGMELKQVAAAMGTTEDGARMRVNRGVQRLREFFTGRGSILSAASITGAVAANSVQAAPVGLAASITATTLSATGVATSALFVTAKTATMTTIQKAVVAATLAVLAGAGIYEARQSAQLSDRLETFRRQQAEEVQNLQNERDDATARLASALDASAAATHNSMELLQMRHEVERLRKLAETSTAAEKDARDSEFRMMQIMSNTPPVRTYYSTSTITTGWNQAVATGGWKTPSGKRALIISRASPESGNPQAVKINFHLLEYTEEAGTAHGLSRFNSDEQGGRHATILSTELFDVLQKAASNQDGVEFVTQQAVISLSGQHCQIQTLDFHTTPSGENYSIGPDISVIPTIDSDGRSVQMVISAHLNYRVQAQQH